MTSSSQAKDLPVFAGEFRHVMDSKHRVTIPAIWRQKDESGGYFLLPASENDHIAAFPPQEFRKVGQQVTENAAISPRDRRIFIRQFYSKAQHCPLDKQGRLILPETLCKLAQLETDLFLVGADSRFEIWNPKQWSKITETEESTYRQVANFIGLY